MLRSSDNNNEGNNNKFELIVSIEDKFNQDKLGSTKERLKYYDLECDNIRIIDFPDKNKHILSDISYILLLSLFFIFIIVIAFSSSLYQLVKQKKISEIKTDFINNMTHEFKTPIATINLALDSIKNPKIINDQEKILRYVKMIRDEKEIYTVVINGVVEHQNDIVNVIAQEAHVGMSEDSALEHLVTVRKERLDENKRRNVDFVQAERELKKNVQQAKAGNL